MSLARRISGVLVFVAITLTVIGGILTAIALLKAAADADNTAVKDRATAMKTLGYIVIAATVIFVCVLVFMRKRIQLAIEVVKEASHSVSDMKWMPFFPIFPFIFALAYFVFWIAVALFIFSVSTQTPTPIPHVAKQCDTGANTCLLSQITSGNYTKNNLDQGKQVTTRTHDTQ